MAKVDYERTPDGYQRILDGNLKVEKALFIPVFTGSPDLNGNPNEPGAIGLDSSFHLVVYNGTSWSAVNTVPSGGTNLQYLRGDGMFETLDTSVVPENGNLYYTSARFNTAFTAKTTDVLTEGSTNLYYTNARVQSYSDARYLQLSAANAANGYPQLDGSALIPLSLLPPSILGDVKYKGTYNGTTVTSPDSALNGNPLPTAASGNQGYYFIVTSPFTLGGVNYAVQDWIISDGAADWTQISNSNSVTTVFGRNGNIVANASDYSAYYPQLSGSYSNPTWITSIQQSIISYSGSSSQYVKGDGSFGTFPTFVSSFTNDSGYLTSASSLAWAKLTSLPTTVSGYGITDIYPSQSGNSGKFLTTNGSSVSWATSGGGSPGGADSQIQYNSSGAFYGSTKYTYIDNQGGSFAGSGLLTLKNARSYIFGDTGTAGTISDTAALQIDSVNYGFLMPRMTQAQRLAITTPAVGLQVYQTDSGTYGEGVYQNRSTGWVSASAGVGGSDSQIQFNASGAFAGTSNFTYNATTKAFFVNTHDYYGYQINANAYCGLTLSYGTNLASLNVYGYIGSGQSSHFGNSNDMSIQNIGGGRLSIEAATIDLVTSNLGLGSIAHIGSSLGTGGGQWEFVGGTEFLMGLAWHQSGGLGGSYLGLQSATNHFTTPQNTEDLILFTNRRIVFDNGGGDNNLGSWMAFDHLHKMVIISGGGVSGGFLTADTSAILQLDSTTRGFALPQMTTTQKSDISSPRSGLVVYDTTLNKLCVFTGSAWETVTSS
jgi:hypothetical protein